MRKLWGNGWVQVALIAIALLVIWWNMRRQMACDAAGGTYLIREGKCIAVRELKP